MKKKEIKEIREHLEAINAILERNGLKYFSMGIVDGMIMYNSDPADTPHISGHKPERSKWLDY